MTLLSFSHSSCAYWHLVPEEWPEYQSAMDVRSAQRDPTSTLTYCLLADSGKWGAIAFNYVPTHDPTRLQWIVANKGSPQWSLKN